MIKELIQRTTHANVLQSFDLICLETQANLDLFQGHSPFPSIYLYDMDLYL